MVKFFLFGCCVVVDRSVSLSLSDARDVLVNVVVDSFFAYGFIILNL